MASELEILLAGIALGAIPTSELGRLLLTYLGKRAGVTPSEIEKYQAATDGENRHR